MCVFFPNSGIRAYSSCGLMTKKEKSVEADGGSMWDPCVESLLNNVKVKWCVLMAVVCSTSPEVSPSNTHGKHITKQKRDENP